MSAAIVYEGKLYRALNPVWAKQPLSGAGAALHGGRFNQGGIPALYCSLSPVTALREAHQVGDLQPTILVGFDAAIETVFDGRSAKALKEFGMTPDTLAAPNWRNEMLGKGEARTQQFTRELAELGFHALLARSFARGATADDLNLVLWRWSGSPPHRLTLIDDENRLGG